MPELENKIIKEPIANEVNREYEIIKRYSRFGSHITFHRKSAKIRYRGKTTIEQNMGSIAAIPIITQVIIDILVSSSHLSFLKVVNRHAKDAKLKTDITGVIIGKTNIKRMYIAFIP